MQSTTTLKRDGNGYPYRETLIGTVTTHEAREHRIGYETASWYTLVNVEPGTYDVVKYEHGSLTWILVRYHGVVTDEHFVNRLFGSESLAPKRDIGKPRSCTSQHYDYIAAKCFHDGVDQHGATWTLADDLHVTAEDTILDKGGKRERPYTFYKLAHHAREGCDRCYCGCKYWEDDTCIDCGTTIAECMRDPKWIAENRTERG